MNLLRCSLALGSLLLFTLPTVAAEPAARVRASFATKGDVWVGQRAILVVELLAPGFFSSAPTFDLPQVSGVIIAEPEDRPIVSSETIDGIAYTVQRHEFAVYTQRGGRVTIPGFVARFEASERFGLPAKSYTVTTPPLNFMAKMPPGAENLATVITTRQLTVKETWTPQPGAAKVGAAFIRTITVEARDIPGMVLPSFAFTPPEGLRAYPRPPEVSDHAERGELTGRRVETVTYICEQPGVRELPAFVLTWWNPQEQKLNRSVLPAQRFEVAAEPQPPASTLAPPKKDSLRKEVWLAVTGVGVVVVVLCAWQFGPRLVKYWKQHQTRVSESEPANFAAFEHTCRVGDASAVYQALLAWLDHVENQSAPVRVADFANLAADPELTSQLSALQDALFKSPGENRSAWSGIKLADRVRIARKRLAWSVGRVGQRQPVLPPLNPS